MQKEMIIIAKHRKILNTLSTAAQQVKKVIDGHSCFQKRKTEKQSGDVTQGSSKAFTARSCLAGARTEEAPMKVMSSTNSFFSTQYWLKRTKNF